MAATPHEQLKQFLQAQYPLPPRVLADFAQAWAPFSAARKALITQAGAREHYLYFVLEGIQRICSQREDEAKEATLVFTYPPSFSGLADAFLHQSPSTFWVECLTPSEFLRISHSDFSRLRQEHAELNDLIVHLAGITLRGLLTRLAELQTLGAEDKFRALLTRSPHLLNLVPHKYLASYLGMDPTTFSKLLGSVRL